MRLSPSAAYRRALGLTIRDLWNMPLDQLGGVAQSLYVSARGDKPELIRRITRRQQDVRLADPVGYAALLETHHTGRR